MAPKGVACSHLYKAVCKNILPLGQWQTSYMSSRQTLAVNDTAFYQSETVMHIQCYDCEGK